MHFVTESRYYSATVGPRRQRRYRQRRYEREGAYVDRGVAR